MSAFIRGGVVSSDGSVGPVTTANSFAEIEVWKVRFLKTKRLHFNVAANGVAYRVTGNLDGGTTFPLTVAGSTVVNIAGGGTLTINEAYDSIRIEVASGTPNSHGTVTLTYFGASY